MPNGPGDEVVLGRASEATLTFGVPVADPDVSGSMRVPVTLRTSRLTTRQDLELESWAGGARRLVAFLDELADAWRGWSGIKEWSDDHYGARFQATHDGIGTVALDVRFEPSSGWETPGSTIVRVVVPVDPGAFESAGRFLKRHLSEADA
ncbi:MAG: DUF6228 family protein [Chloroflexota bacterium]|nr:DUF6228 family protein [Chloroflexota bacterium]